MSIPDLAWFKSSYSSGQGDNCIEVALSWRKSSYSSGSGDNCIEVAATWRKSSYSSSAQGDCIEVSECPETIHVRDSKDKEGPQLAFSPGEWAAFTAYAAQL